MRRALFLTVALSLATAWPAAAQGLKVDFHDGRVTVDATAVPVRAILTEWGKVGGTKIVGAERISGAPLTVKLINVTEAQALETILRSVAGYMAAPRSTGAGSSMYDRILVMATTSAPPPSRRNCAPGAATPNTAFTGTQRFVPPRQRSGRNSRKPDEAKSRTRIRRARRSSRSRSRARTASRISRASSRTRRERAGLAITVNPATAGRRAITINPATPPGQPTGAGRRVAARHDGQSAAPQRRRRTPPPTMIRPPAAARRSTVTSYQLPVAS